MTLRIGTRRSKLALAQANEVASALDASGVRTELVPITTAGDRGADPASDPDGARSSLATVASIELTEAERLELADESADVTEMLSAG